MFLGVREIYAKNYLFMSSESFSMKFQVTYIINDGINTKKLKN